MTLKIGEPISNIKLPNINGEMFELSSLKGKRVLISFHRFATCPFCNLHVHQLVKNFSLFNSKFTVAAIFDSSLEHLQQHATDHKAPFAILADTNKSYYQQFNIDMYLSR